MTPTILQLVTKTDGIFEPSGNDFEVKKSKN
jgi:hypothetical protein